MSRAILFVLLVLAAAVPVTAKLRQAAMRLPEELSAAERWEVKGRQGWKLLQRLDYGGVRVFGVQRSLTKGGDLQILFYHGSKRRQTFRFSVADRDGELWQGAAATNLRRRAVEHDGFAAEFRNQSGFSAQLSPADEPEAAWLLELFERSEQPLGGTLRRGAETLAVKGTQKLAGTPLPLGETAGYVITRGGRAIAAVEVMNNGAVWLAPDLPAHLRMPVIAAISALLLFEELRPTLPN